MGFNSGFKGLKRKKNRDIILCDKSIAHNFPDYFEKLQAAYRSRIFQFAVSPCPTALVEIIAVYIWLFH